MTGRRIGAVLATSLCLQIVISAPSFPASIEAQGTRDVFVIEGSGSLDDCQVVYETSDDPSFRKVNDRTKPVPCQGGVVWAYRATQAEAESRTRSAGTDDRRIVRLSGNATKDEAAIKREMASLQAKYAAKSGESTTVGQSVFGFAAPGSEIGIASAAVPAAARCNEGRIGEYKSSIATWYARRPNARVQAVVFYQRVTCREWNLYAIRAGLLDNPEDRIYYREFRYSDLTEDRDGRLDRTQTNCPELKANGTKRMGFDENFIAGRQAVHEAEDDEFQPGIGRCRELGNSYTSAAITIRGGTS